MIEKFKIMGFRIYGF